MLTCNSPLLYRVAIAIKAAEIATAVTAMEIATIIITKETMEFPSLLDVLL